jgi:hypothetical protein
LKWFKHISDSLTDPFISDLIDKHGVSAYIVFFGILEIYAREYKPDPDWKLVVTLPYLCRILHLSRYQLCINSVSSIALSGKWEVKQEQNTLTIYIPKFHELLDNWQTRKVDKLRSSDVVTTKKLPNQLEVEEDKDITPSLFETFWKAYPKKKLKGNAEKAWIKAKVTNGRYEQIMNKLEILKKSKDWQKEEGKFIPHPATWLNGKGWEDEPLLFNKQGDSEFL